MPSMMGGTFGPWRWNTGSQFLSEGTLFVEFLLLQWTCPECRNELAVTHAASFKEADAIPTTRTRRGFEGR